MLIIWTLCNSGPRIIIPLFKLIDWLPIGRKKNADHMDLECSGSYHTHSPLQIHQLAFRFYNPVVSTTVSSGSFWVDNIRRSLVSRPPSLRG